MIDGLVISFVNINKLKQAEQTVVNANLTSAIVDTVGYPLLVLDERFQIVKGNQAFYSMFKVDR